ncbi:MAG: hypothetical protein HC880_16570 [Bacteroidia bacterium]|nr:hypothetical protein [Bacteroidia bacterium]
MSMHVYPNQVTQNRLTLVPSFGQVSHQAGLVRVSDLTGNVLESFPVASGEKIVLDVTRYRNNQVLIMDADHPRRGKHFATGADSALIRRSGTCGQVLEMG